MKEMEEMSTCWTFWRFSKYIFPNGSDVGCERVKDNFKLFS